MNLDFSSFFGDTTAVIYYAILALVLLDFYFDLWMDKLMYKSYSYPIPDSLNDIYDSETLIKQKNYHIEHYKFGMRQALLSFLITISILSFKFFGILDSFLRTYIENEFLITILFFAILGFGYSLISLPFSYHETFVIEQKYGFNTSTKKTFWFDLAKSLLLSIVLGVPLLWAILAFYHYTGSFFWIYTWILIVLFSLFFTFFYSKLIVPLFNKQNPLPEGELKDAIFEFCKKADFPLKEVYVLDASKRSNKANAYFTGFGKNKRIVLFDTLINQLSTDEIVAVLAHEIGHFKKKHIIKSFITGMFSMAVTLFILSLFLNIPEFSYSQGAEVPSFHIGIIVFGILFSPISTLTSFISNYLSRKNENEADLFAKEHQQAQPLISALKKLAAKNYSHLTPHPLYVKLHFSHPPLADRIKLLEK